MASCHPTNSVKELKGSSGNNTHGNNDDYNNKKYQPSVYWHCWLREGWNSIQTVKKLHDGMLLVEVWLKLGANDLCYELAFPLLHHHLMQ